MYIGARPLQNTAGPVKSVPVWKFDPLRHLVTLYTGPSCACISVCQTGSVSASHCVHSGSSGATLPFAIAPVRYTAEKRKRETSRGAACGGCRACACAARTRGSGQRSRCLGRCPYE
jgi:hypothetical protein